MKTKMTSKIILAAVMGLSGSAFAQSSDKKLQELEDRISELEAMSSLNIFKFNGTLETRYDSIKSKQDTPAASAIDGNVDYFRLKASLGIDADVSRYIKFYSKLTMSKYSNLYGTQSVGTGASPIINEDLNAANDERGAQLFVEKAYADAMIGDSGFVFSFGRLPTSDGPPFELRHGRPRMGTYPGLIYNAELDGVALTYGTKWGDQSLAVRVVHSPFTRRTDTRGASGGTGIITNPTIAGNASKTIVDLDTFMGEYTLNNLGWADRLTVIAQAWQLGKIPVNGNDLTISGLGAGTSTSAIESKIGAQGVHIGLDNVGQLGLDLGYSFIQSKVENSGCIRFAAAGNTCQVYGFGATSEGETLEGSSSLIAARYKFLANDFVGAEYLMGGKNVFVYDANNETLANFYSTPGTGTHAYVLHKFTPELGLRVGYMEQKYKNTPFTFGASSDTDRKITTYYTNLRLDF